MLFLVKWNTEIGNLHLLWYGFTICQPLEASPLKVDNIVNPYHSRWRFPISVFHFTRNPTFLGFIEINHSYTRAMIQCEHLSKDFQACLKSQCIFKDNAGDEILSPRPLLKALYFVALKLTLRTTKSST